MSDYTDKAILKEQMIKYGFTAPDMTVTEFVEDIVPSAEPERKKPDYGYMWICPECGLEVHSDFVRCVRCGWERTSADLTCDGCATPKTICGICMRNYPNITDHYCTGEAWTEGKG